MRPIGKLMAMLNPKNCRFDVGTGGIPELTSEDVAGALAFVPAGIGRELLCRVYWPDGAALTAATFDQMLLDAQMAEWGAREKAMYQALAEIACSKHGATHVDRRLKAVRAYDHAHHKRWPGILEAENAKKKTNPLARYAGIRRGVIEELVSPRRCTKCAGKGEIRALGLLKLCVRCNGEGSINHSIAWRASITGVEPSSFSRRWEEPYEWLVNLLRTELQKAEYELRRALDQRDKAA